MQFTDTEAGETQENSRQEAHHTTGDLSAPTSSLNYMEDQITVTQENPSQPTRERIHWPKLNNIKWSRFEEDLDSILEATLVVMAEKLDNLSTLSYNLSR